MGTGTRFLGQCARKRHYATRAEAERAAANLSGDEGAVREAYRCRHCGLGFLVGTAPDYRQHIARARPTPGRRRVGWEELKRRGM